MPKNRPYNPEWVDWADHLYHLDQTILGIKTAEVVLSEKWRRNSLRKANEKRKVHQSKEPRKYL